MACNANGIRSDIRQVDPKLEELRADFREDVAALRDEIGNERRVQQARLDAFAESILAIAERRSNIEGRLLRQPVIVDVPRDSESDSASWRSPLPPATRTSTPRSRRHVRRRALAFGHRAPAPIVLDTS